jgi:hypothetical protein
MIHIPTRLPALFPLCLCTCDWIVARVDEHCGGRDRGDKEQKIEQATQNEKHVRFFG